MYVATAVMQLSLFVLHGDKHCMCLEFGTLLSSWLCQPYPWHVRDEFKECQGFNSEELEGFIETLFVCLKCFIRHNETALLKQN